MVDKTPKSNEPAIYLKSAIYPSQCNFEKKNRLDFKTGAHLRQGPGKKEREEKKRKWKNMADQKEKEKKMLEDGRLPWVHGREGAGPRQKSY